MWKPKLYKGRNEFWNITSTPVQHHLETCKKAKHKSQGTPMSLCRKWRQLFSTITALRLCSHNMFDMVSLQLKTTITCSRLQRSVANSIKLMMMRLLEMLLPRLAWTAVQAAHAPDGKYNWRCFTWTVWKKRTVFLIPVKLLHSEITDVCHFVIQPVAQLAGEEWRFKPRIIWITFCFYMMGFRIIVCVTQNRVLNFPGCYFWKS